MATSISTTHERCVYDLPLSLPHHVTQSPWEGPRTKLDPNVVVKLFVCRDDARANTEGNHFGEISKPYDRGDRAFALDSPTHTNERGREALSLNRQFVNPNPQP